MSPHSHCYITTLLLMCATALTAQVVDAATITSTFDSGNQGWTQHETRQVTLELVTVLPVNYSANGGNPGGYIWDTDPSAQGWGFGAPGAYLGNKTSFIGGEISFDFSTTTTATATALLWLRSTSILLIYSPPASNVTTSFTHYSAQLGPGPGWDATALAADGTATGSFFAPTQANFASAMGNLTEVMVRGDWVDGNETPRLDNFTMMAVPEPSGLLLFCAPVAGLWMMRRRMRKA